MFIQIRGEIIVGDNGSTDGSLNIAEDHDGQSL
jgi:glycosyltransferase involved in cell wall biosynthesis